MKVKVPFITVEWPTGFRDTTETVTLWPNLETGSLIGHLKGTKKFIYVPLYEEGDFCAADVGTIDNVDDDEDFVRKLNAFFGTEVTINDFPGR